MVRNFKLLDLDLELKASNHSSLTLGLLDFISGDKFCEMKKY